MAGLDDAVQELYQVPLTEFVAERKRLAGELKGAGEASAAKELLARKRPTISAWVVNQLYWHARDAFDDMLKTAERLRSGDLKATADHREAIAKLRKRAAMMLQDAGHSATEATLRRVTMTLSALAATGGFDPDPPGALAADRDPPGFEAVGIPSEPIERAAPPPKTAGHAKDEVAEARAKAAVAQKARDAEAAERRAEEMAEKKREEAVKKRLAADRHRLEAALRTAKTELGERERDVKQLEKQLTSAHKAVDKAQELVDDIERKLEELDDDSN